jgi:hypothetical protein
MIIKGKYLTFHDAIDAIADAFMMMIGTSQPRPTHLIQFELVTHLAPLKYIFAREMALHPWDWWI